MEKGSGNVISTGIDRFDEVLGGGFPRNSMMLFLEDVGSEADIVALQILWNRLKAGDLGALYNFDLPPMELREKMKTYGWDVKKYEEEEKFILADMFTYNFDLARFYPKEKYYCKRPNDISYIANFAHEVREEILQRTKPGKYFGVILSAERLLNFNEEKDVIKLAYSTGMKFRLLGNGVLILDPRVFSKKGLAMLENFADMVVRFSIEQVDKSFERFLRVVKSPLYGYLNEQVPYTITPIEGVVVHNE